MFDVDTYSTTNPPVASMAGIQLIIIDAIHFFLIAIAIAIAI